MLSQKLTGILSICRKAGKMEIGFAPMKETLPTGRVKGVVTASDSLRKRLRKYSSTVRNTMSLFAPRR